MLLYAMLLFQGMWRLETECSPTIQSLIINQYNTGKPVTQQSGAILKIPIVRDMSQLNNDDIEITGGLGKVKFTSCYP